ncbi:hypothetical protein GW17_00038680 [Ensete ventricosum]|nr:hypothetical protein GW17_00038680 [Ensete ventricosum]
MCPSHHPYTPRSRVGLPTYVVGNSKGSASVACCWYPRPVAWPAVKVVATVTLGAPLRPTAPERNPESPGKHGGNKDSFASPSAPTLPSPPPKSKETPSHGPTHRLTAPVTFGVKDGSRDRRRRPHDVRCSPDVTPSFIKSDSLSCHFRPPSLRPIIIIPREI